MRVCYLACDVDLGMGHGGATHVREVAENLAALGHDVHVVARCRASGSNPAYHSSSRRVPRQARVLNWMWLRRELRNLRPDVVIERYYNFGGEGALLKRETAVPFVLEVNSPMIDYRGSPKEWLDRLLLFRPLERYRNWIGECADLIVTPLPQILPPGTDPQKVLRLPWGANTDRFQPDGKKAMIREKLCIPPHAAVALFTGSFRRWHGAETLVRASCDVMQRSGVQLYVMLIGEGPTLGRAMQYASEHAPAGRIISTGRVAYEEMPAYMEAADFAVAPFDTSAHKHLQLGFYWSPLKIFEAMAVGLPVVTIRVPEIVGIVGDGGLYYDEGDCTALTAAITQAASDAGLREAMGRTARERVKAFSWRAHCQALSDRLGLLVSR
ncbi:MAG: glycosyltransferase family 4 protein [Acidobacteria bacterium]|nr:glycosyltransferase family 4 protein [Acidobacteriota bacterium]